MLENDSLARVLYIDLSKKSFHIDRRKDLFEKHLGGTGVATELLHQECPPGCDPLGPNNPIIFAVGPLTALFPLASKTVAMFKSPHTGNLGESHCGGRSAVAIRMAGFGAIVIKGASSFPIYLAIHGDQVSFKDATTLWGMSSNFTAGRVIREREPGAGMRTIMRIGRAGEKLVSYAMVTTETYRHFGRLGLGAVFGSKNLKAITISGKRSLPVHNRKDYRKLYDEIYSAAVETPVMKKYHDLGTAANILPLNSMGGLPTRNLQQARFEKIQEISGEAFAERFLGRRLACAHCPVGCIHIAALRQAYENEAYFYKTSMICYDYEPIYAIGTMLGGHSAKGFLELMDAIEALGLDVMSTGVVLAWATEAFEKGLITTRETRGLQFEWGNYTLYGKAVQLIVEQPNDFYSALAQGVDHASETFGGREFALAFGKNEMPGYHTGPGAHIGYLVGTRHSHLDNAGYSIDQKILTKKELQPEELADHLIHEEQWRQVLSSLVICFFARGIYSLQIVSRTLQTAGFDCDENRLEHLGNQIYRRKYQFKLREGFSFENLRIPGRIFETPAFIQGFNEEYMRRALKRVKDRIDSVD